VFGKTVVLRTRHVRAVTKILDDIIEEYKKETPKAKRDWRTYEQRLAKRIRTAISELEPLVDEAIASIKTLPKRRRGRKPELALKQKTNLLLLKHLIGKSFKSEDEAFSKAIEMVTETGMASVRLDKYYSGQKRVELLGQKFGNVTVYLIPRKNATVRGPWEWKQMLKRFVNNPHYYLREYFRRNQSESGFSEDKHRFGWKVVQKREDRIDTANFCTMIWHNLFWLD
jgi:transposase